MDQKTTKEEMFNSVYSFKLSYTTMSIFPIIIINPYIELLLDWP